MWSRFCIAVDTKCFEPTYISCKKVFVHFFFFIQQPRQTPVCPKIRTPQPGCLSPVLATLTEGKREKSKEGWAG